MGFPEKATLNTHINVKKYWKIYYLSMRLIKNQIRRKSNMKKPTCNQAIEYLNALQCFVQCISEVPQQICMTLWDMENYVLQQTEKN
jgi:hypothetical protein